MTLEEKNELRRQKYAERIKDPEYRSKLKETLRAYYQANKARIRATTKAWEKRNKERHLASKRDWVKRNKAKDSESHKKSYFRNRDRRLQYRVKYYQDHKEECLNRWRKKLESNPDYNKVKSRKHYQNNKEYYHLKYLRRKALQKKATVNLAGIKEFVESVKSKRFATCYYCEKSFLSVDCHFDHIVPLSKGGSHSVDNLCVSCQKCNLSKGAKHVHVWIRVGQQLMQL